jgi:hypothetical protein
MIPTQRGLLTNDTITVGLSVPLVFRITFSVVEATASRLGRSSLGKIWSQACPRLHRYGPRWSQSSLL